MTRLSSAAVAAALLLAVSAVPAKVNAATVTWMADNGITAGNITPQVITGSVSSITALSYASDWVEFVVNPSSLSAVTVDVLANFANGPSYPNEFYQLLSGSVSGATVVGPTAVTNTPNFIGLSTGVLYFLELASGGPSTIDNLQTVGTSSLSIQVPTGDNEIGPAPLPGALALFAGGLGLLGFAGLRRSRKTGRSLAS
jgi:hypothetical protein